MVAKRKIPEEPYVPPSVNAQTGISLLKKQIEKATELLSINLDDWSDHTAWNNTTRDYLIRVFGSNSPNISAVIHAHSSVPMYMNMGQHDSREYKKSLIENQIKMLQSCIEQLETEIELSRDKKEEGKTTTAQVITDDIFVVHGRNHSIKEEVVNLLKKLNLAPIILHEQPNSGKTLIEKFIGCSNVDFAVVILSGDDLGKSCEENELKKRVRQNVVFELGYFIGKLGRSRVCALYEEGVEFPSDYEGVVYVPLDPSGKWKFDLVRELKAAGYNIDANRIL